MEKSRIINVNFNEAKVWYYSGDETLKSIALRAFSEEEMMHNFWDITTFKKACEVLGLNYDVNCIVVKDIATTSKASAAMYKLNIIRKALNLGYDLSLTKKTKGVDIYYPYNPFVTSSSTYYTNELDTGKMEAIGIFKCEGISYKVLGGHTINNGYEGLGAFLSHSGVGTAYADFGLLGCATEKIAQHFGKYFGMLITEAKYADMLDFEIKRDKYGNAVSE